jgi:hypothetical protein
MRITLLRNLYFSGPDGSFPDGVPVGHHLFAGETIDLPDDFAASIVANGEAEMALGSDAPAPPAPVEEVEDVVEAVETTPEPAPAPEAADTEEDEVSEPATAAPKAATKPMSTRKSRS